MGFYRKIIKNMLLLVITIGLFVSNSIMLQAKTITEFTLNDWNRYGSTYLSSQLKYNERLFYLNMNKMASDYLITDKDAIYNKTHDCYTTELVEVNGIAEERMQEIWQLFIYENPQYYFLKSTVLLYSDGVKFTLYDSFSNDKSRRYATRRFQRELQSIEQQVKIDLQDSVSKVSQYEIEKAIHDVVCSITAYDNDFDINNKEMTRRDPTYSQSAYSAAVLGKTVCTGYAKLYSMLCNSFNIECLCVGGKAHIWNVVKYNENWYGTDLTLDDVDLFTFSDTYFHNNRASFNAGVAESRVTDRVFTSIAPEISEITKTNKKGISKFADLVFKQKGSNLFVSPK